MHHATSLVHFIDRHIGAWLLRCLAAMAGSVGAAGRGGLDHDDQRF